MNTYRITLITLALIATSIAAANQPPPPPAPKASAHQHQHQAQAQQQSQGQAQSASQQVTTGATAISSPTVTTNISTGSTATASNAGNAQTVLTERSAPGVAQGSFAIQGCGVAGNAGASQTGGAAFLGFGFTPEQCYDFQLAQAYAALGAYSEACEVLNASKAGQRAKKRGVTLPHCAAPAQPTPAAPAPAVIVNVPAPAAAAAKAECSDQASRAFKQCVSK